MVKGKCFMKKKILIAILVIIVIAIAIFAYFMISDLQQEQKLKDELTELNNLSNAETIDINAINERLNRTITKGDYAVVEQAFKQYLKDSFDNTMKIAEIINDDRIINLLTVSNYQEDGKDFIESKNYINTTRESLENYKNEYKNFFTEEKVMSYINDKGLDSYYTDFYKEEIVGDIEAEGADTTVEDSINELINILNVSEKVINFLSENQNSWQIQGENITFDRQELFDEYEQLISELPG